MPPLAHVPSRGFRDEKDEANDDDGRQHRRSHHKSPVESSNAGCVLDLEECKIGRITQHDSKSGPHLPLHDESTTDGFGSSFGAIDGDSCGFGTNTESKGEAGDEHVPPCVGERLPETCERGEDTGDEDGTAAAEIVVEWDSEPASDKGAAEIGSRVDQSKQPGRSRVLACDTELRSVEKLTTINNSLVYEFLSVRPERQTIRASHTHSLDGSTRGAKSNDPVHEARLGPPVREFLIPDRYFLGGHALEGFELL